MNSLTRRVGSTTIKSSTLSDSPATLVADNDNCRQGAKDPRRKQNKGLNSTVEIKDCKSFNKTHTQTYVYGLTSIVAHFKNSFFTLPFTEPKVSPSKTRIG